MTASEIAELVQGELVGDASLELRSVQTLEKAGISDLAFWERKGSRDSLPETGAGCVIVDPETRSNQGTLIRADKPRLAFARAVRSLVRPPRRARGIDPSAKIHATAELGDDVTVGAFAIVEADARIGDRTVIGGQAFVGAGSVIGTDCHLHPGSRVYGDTRIGNRVVLHGGAVIGADGFGLVFDGDRYEKFPQVGGVRIDSDVEIGANACVDRGALDMTRIGRGSKLDNLVHVGHNCQIGRHVVMAAQVGLSGGVVIEDYAILGGQAGIGDRARIGSGARLGGQVGLLPDKELAAGGSYWGTPARPLREQLASQARVARLPRLFDEVRRLRARVEELESS